MGGFQPGIGNLEATWTWDGDSWTHLNGDNPSSRSSCPIAFDPIRKQLVLFSGCAGRPYPTDTFVFSGDGWMEVANEGPPGVCRGALFFDEVRETIVLFGGAISSEDGWKRSNNMWEWDGSKWTEIFPDVKPPGRSNILMAYDSNRKRAVLFGGKTEEAVADDLWEWDGMKWYPIEKSSNWPKGVETYGLTYHDRLQKVFLYGGRTGPSSPIEDFWSWDGIQWEKID